MSLAKSGQIKNVCLPNALMTLAEYTEDYGDADFRRRARAAIDSSLPEIASEKMRGYAAESVAKIRAGERDFYV
jgi:2-iminoacetate synthase